MWVLLIFVVVQIGSILYYQFKEDRATANKRLDLYRVNQLETSWGKMNYIDEGQGLSVLISHGIFGGYDQGYVSIQSIVGDRYRRIVPSRFGYLETEVPDEPTPTHQAEAYLELLNHLNIQQTFVLSTSAGSAAALMFAINHPERVQGLIMLSSDVPHPSPENPPKNQLTGPPSFVINDFVM